MVGSYPSLALHYAKDMFEWKAQVYKSRYLRYKIISLKISCSTEQEV